MEAISLVAIALIAITFAIIAITKISPTFVLVTSNVAVFVITAFWYGDMINPATYDLCFSGSSFFEEPWRIITSMFMHSGIEHLLFNMIFLVVIGIPLETRMGRWRFVSVYVTGGMIGSAVFAIVDGSSLLAVGASGAISALMGAMIMLYPREKIMFFLGPILTNRFKVWVPILVWFGMQLFLFVFDSGSLTAYSAHLGGFAGGAAVAWMIRPRGFGQRGSLKKHDISALKQLCVTAALKERYEYAENARDDETRKMWIESILGIVRCPECGSEIKAKGKGFRCANGHEL